jgi:DNA-binding transcriptional ArsR family regulator
LHALADPVRLAIVRALWQAPDGLNCTEAMAVVNPDLPKSTCSQHFQTLREAGVIHSERKGVELTSRLRLDDINARFPGLLQSILAAYEAESCGSDPNRSNR